MSFLWLRFIDLSLLEELNFEKNKITKIEGLENLVYLKKLELGKNKITVVENLGKSSHSMHRANGSFGNL